MAYHRRQISFAMLNGIVHAAEWSPLRQSYPGKRAAKTGVFLDLIRDQNDGKSEFCQMFDDVLQQRLPIKQDKAIVCIHSARLTTCPDRNLISPHLVIHQSRLTILIPDQSE